MTKVIKKEASTNKV